MKHLKLFENWAEDDEDYDENACPSCGSYEIDEYDEDTCCDEYHSDEEVG